MGCSPSKGQPFVGVCDQEDKALQFENNSGLLSDRTEQPQKPISNGAALLEKEEDYTPVPLKGKISSPCIEACDTTTIARGNVDIKETSVYPGETNRLDKTRKKISSPVSRKRLDPPDATVKAHEAAFAYLDTNIPKYESILEILDKVRQAQLSLQPLVTLLVLQYEEMNQTMEELAVLGEKMLEDHRIDMAWPGAEMDGEMYSDSSDLLHHAISKIRLVGDSVMGQGDTALEEAVDYFGSLSYLLGEKLVGKRTAEARLKQVLSCIEAAAQMKPSPKDSALHSEDSGIGADNECQNGSGQLCGQQASSGLGESCSQNSSPDQLVNKVEENRAQDDDNGDDVDASDTTEEDEKTKDEPKSQRKVYCCSHEDSSQYGLQVSVQNNRPASCTVKQINQRKRNISRPQTAGNPPVPRQRKPTHPRRSRSADCLFSKVDVMVKGQHRRQNDSQKVDKQCSDAVLPTSCQPVYAPEPPGRNAVKRLINTFSQGVHNAPIQKPFTRPTSRFRGSKRHFLPRLTYGKDGVSINGSHPSHKRLSERPEDVDVDSLPPPPPELLMDNPLESNEGPPGDVERQDISDQKEKSNVSHLHSTLQRKPLLPSRATISRCYYPRRQDNVVEEQFEEDVDQQARDDTEREESVGIYQHSSNSSGHQSIVRASSVGLGVRTAIRHGYKDSDDGETANPYSNCRPPTTPPVSRARIPPSSNSVCHRLPSPPSLPPSSNCPVNGQWEASTAKSTSNVQRWTRRSSDEENGMSDSDALSFYDARSIFSQATQSSAQPLRPSCRSTLPRPWGEASRGKLQATRLPQTFTRCIPSNYSPTLTDQRPSLSTDPEPHNQGSEDRRDSAVQIPEQEAPTSCLLFGAQQAEPGEIIDNQD